MPPRLRSLAELVSLLLFGTVPGLVLCACGSTSGPARPGARSVEAQAAAVLLELARCVRAHGVPTFPDPELSSDGAPRFPDSAPRVPLSAQRACRTIAARIPPQYTTSGPSQPVSSADFQSLLRLARCLRAHAIPDWPDPNALGEFPVDAGIQAAGKRLLTPALQTCTRLDPVPHGGIDVVQAR